MDAGLKYPSTWRDADSELLSGSNSYQLRLPKDRPAALIWAVTAHNITDGATTAAPQLRPSIHGINDVVENADGSVDLFFGPSKPADAFATDWIENVDGRTFLLPCDCTAPARKSTIK